MTSGACVKCVASLVECRKALDEHRVWGCSDGIQFALNRLAVRLINALFKTATLLFFTAPERLGERARDVVVYLTGTVGDVTVTLPVLVALRRKYPGARLSVLLAGNPLLREQFFRHLPYVDRMENISEEHLRGMRCDLFVNLSGSRQIGWIRHLAREMRYARRLGASAVIGFDISTFWLDKWLRTLQDRCLRNEPQRHLSLARQLDDSPLSAEDLFPRDAQVSDEVLRVLGLRADDAFAVVVPGASRPAKRWSPERFADIARRLRGERNLKSIVIGTPQETSLVGEVVSRSEGAAVSAAGKLDVWGMVELLRLAKLCVTNDTGPLHIASALRVPTVAIFSPCVPPTWWFPAGNDLRVLFSLRPCSPCFATECEHANCLSDITSEDVWSAVIDLPAYRR
jgi:ADP-heptose:LPS heptosyltransferase